MNITDPRNHLFLLTAITLAAACRTNDETATTPDDASTGGTPMASDTDGTREPATGGSSTTSDAPTDTDDDDTDASDTDPGTDTDGQAENGTSNEPQTLCERFGARHAECLADGSPMFAATYAGYCEEELVAYGADPTCLAALEEQYACLSEASCEELTAEDEGDDPCAAEDEAFVEACLNER